jgi:hypothetical protein
MTPLQPQKLYGVQLRKKDQYKYGTGMNLGERQEKERGKQLRESTKMATIKQSLKLGAIHVHSVISVVRLRRIDV